jgi:hypothetical protein
MPATWGWIIRCPREKRGHGKELTCQVYRYCTVGGTLNSFKILSSSFYSILKPLTEQLAYPNIFKTFPVYLLLNSA